MHRPIRSPPDDRDDHLRGLIDQRTARADAHGRFSAAVSEYSDTPSIYSHPYFSPRPSEHGDRNGGYPYSTPMPDTRSVRNDRHDPQSSMLDLDDDRRTSYASSEVYDQTNDNDNYDEGAGEEEKAAVARMSYLGPKMRFHSRAPWEEGALEEEDEEPEEGHRHFPAHFPFSLKSGTKSMASGSSSPRPSFSAASMSRPSVDSSRLPAKRSFETISSQVSYPRGALYALAQESLSTSSLARPSPPAAPSQKEGLRHKFSLGRLRTDPPAIPTAPLPSTPIASPARMRPPMDGGFPTPPTNIPTGSIGSKSTDSFEYAGPPKGGMHPYANPDLVVSYAEEQASTAHLRPNANYRPPRNDSNLTVRESYSTDSVARSSSRSTLTPDTSVNSVASKFRVSAISTKSISGPVSLIGPPQPISQGPPDSPLSSSPAPTSNFAGWTDRSAAAPFALISLEEARAQRMRNSTTAPGSESSTPFPPSSSDHSSATDSLSSPFTNITTRARGRSISAGAKAKNVIHTMVGQPKMERRESEPVFSEGQAAAGPPPGKTLNKKKSGFMRLFNAKSQESDRDSPPPVPSLPDGVNQYQGYQRTPVASVPRVPVPSLAPSLFESPTEDVFAGQGQASKSPKRAAPPVLSINTISHGANARSSTADRPQQGTLLDRPYLNPQPQSAPANVSEFPVLRLRPVSTLFSAQFGDHIVTSEPRSSDETTDSGTPRSPSPSTLMSPITPVSVSRPSHDQARIASSTAHDDQPVVKALQEQMVSAKKVWQRHIWELEGQVRDLKAELEVAKAKNTGEFCDQCGRGKRPSPHAGGSVVHRPRARTAVSSRFANPLP